VTIVLCLILAAVLGLALGSFANVAIYSGHGD